MVCPVYYLHPWPPRRAPTGLVRLLGILVCLASAAPVQAHPGHEVTVDHLTREFRDHPERIDLLRLRGEIHHRNGAHEEALADLLAAQALDPANAETRLCLASVRLDLADPAGALAELDGLTDDQRNSVSYLDLRSRVMEAAGRQDEALGLLDDALALRPSQPRDWLRRADLCLAIGEPDNALRGLDRGCRELGHPWVLIQRAADLEADRDRPEAALSRLALAPEMIRKSHLYWIRRGDLLSAAGHNLDALAAWTEALNRLEALPAHRRATTDARTAAVHLREKLHAE